MASRGGLFHAENKLDFFLDPFWAIPFFWRLRLAWHRFRHTAPNTAVLDRVSFNLNACEP
jgi:hypothetical protein